MGKINKLKTALAAGAIALGVAQTDAQVAMQKVKDNGTEHVMQILTSANGTDANYDPNDPMGPGNPAYTIFEGNNNIAIGPSEMFGRIGFFVPDENGDYEYVDVGDTNLRGGEVEPIVVAGETVNWDQSKTLLLDLFTLENNSGFNYTGLQKRSYADTNNDGQHDMNINEITRPNDTNTSGLQVGTIASIKTPQIKLQSPGWYEHYTYKIYQGNGQWEDLLIDPITGDDLPYIAEWAESALMVNEVKQENTQIYPNPVSDRLFVQLPAGVEVESYGVYDMVGQQVSMSDKLNDQRGIEVHHLPNGVYFLKIKTNKGTAVVHKFIKK